MSERAVAPKKLSRRDFLRGTLKPREKPIRPPWVNERSLINHCTRCNKCATACPENIIIHGPDGFPKIQFSGGECTFCGDCVNVCPEADKIFHLENPAFNHKTLIQDNCLTKKSVFCRSCGDVCPERAIQFKARVGGKADIVVNDQQCTSCGACYAVCPVNAVSFVINNDQEESNVHE